MIINKNTCSTNPNAKKKKTIEAIQITNEAQSGLPIVFSPFFFFFFFFFFFLLFFFFN